jgi:hypothetical protein
MGEAALEQEGDDLADAAWHQHELEERQQREDAAIKRCRPLQDELRHVIDTLNDKYRNTP